MAEIEQHIASLLREIAGKVKDWEDRDLREAKESGASRLSRPAYYADLEAVAAMLEGRHIEHKLVRQRPGRGRPGDPADVDRDLGVAKLIAQYRRDPDLKVKDGILLAMDQFGMSESAVQAADKRMKNIATLEPGEQKIVLFFERLAARGIVKASRLQTPEK